MYKDDGSVGSLILMLGVIAAISIGVIAVIVAFNDYQVGAGSQLPSEIVNNSAYALTGNMTATGVQVMENLPFIAVIFLLAIILILGYVWLKGAR